MGASVEVYQGMVVGQKSFADDLDVNAGKQRVYLR